MVGFAEEAGGFIQEEYVQELQRAYLKQALLKLIDTEARFLCDVLDAEACGKMLLHVLQRCRQFGKAAGFVAGGIQITRDAGDADDTPGRRAKTFIRETSFVILLFTPPAMMESSPERTVFVTMSSTLSWLASPLKFRMTRISAAETGRSLHTI